MKKFIGFVLTLSILFTICTFSSSIAIAKSNNLPQQVKQAALSGLETIKLTVNSDPEKWGFKKDVDTSNLTLGPVLPVYFINADKLKSENNSILNMTSFANAYEFVVYLNNTPTIILTVAYDNNSRKYKMVRYGGTSLELDSGIKLFKNLAKSKNINGEPRLVEIQNDFYLVGKNDNEEFVLPRVHSSFKANALGIENMDNFVSPQYIINKLKNAKGGRSGRCKK